MSSTNQGPVSSNKRTNGAELFPLFFMVVVAQAVVWAHTDVVACCGRDVASPFLLQKRNSGLHSGSSPKVQGYIVKLKVVIGSSAFKR